MKEKIKRVMSICENCEEFYSTQYIHKKRAFKKEYRCNIDECYFEQTVNGVCASDCLSIDDYKNYPLSKKCHFILEHTILNQKIPRNDSICENCKDRSAWSISGEKFCLLSSSDFAHVREYVKWSREDLSIANIFSDFKVKHRGDESEQIYRNNIPDDCPYILEHVVIGDEEVNSK